MTVRSFTLGELAAYNGRDGAPAYIAHQGVVYDVSHSYYWKGGRHQVTHSAGADLTAELAQAPHSIDMLERVPAIGVLSSSQ